MREGWCSPRKSRNGLYMSRMEAKDRVSSLSFLISLYSMNELTDEWARESMLLILRAGYSIPGVGFNRWSLCREQRWKSGLQSSHIRMALSKLKYLTRHRRHRGHVRAASGCVKSIPRDGKFARSLLYVIGAGVDTLIDVTPLLFSIRQPVMLIIANSGTPQKGKKKVLP